MSADRTTGGDSASAATPSPRRGRIFTREWIVAELDRILGDCQAERSAPVESRFMAVFEELVILRARLDCTSPDAFPAPAPAPVGFVLQPLDVVVSVNAHGQPTFRRIHVYLPQEEAPVEPAPAPAADASSIAATLSQQAAILERVLACLQAPPPLGAVTRERLSGVLSRLRSVYADNAHRLAPAPQRDLLRATHDLSAILAGEPA